MKEIIIFSFCAVENMSKDLMTFQNSQGRLRRAVKTSYGCPCGAGPINLIGADHDQHDGLYFYGFCAACKQMATADHKSAVSDPAVVPA